VARANQNCKESFSARLRALARAAGIQCGRGKARTIFAGGKGFCFTLALFGFPSCRRVREECAVELFY